MVRKTYPNKFHKLYSENSLTKIFWADRFPERRRSIGLLVGPRFGGTAGETVWEVAIDTTNSQVQDEVEL